MLPRRALHRKFKHHHVCKTTAATRGYDQKFSAYSIISEKIRETFFLQSSMYSSSISSLNKEKHDKNVAMAQSRIFTRLGPLKQQPPELSVVRDAIVPRISLRERKIVLEAIRHWLFKDPIFFDSTMDALNLNFRGDNVINQNNNSVNRLHPLQAVYDQYRQLYFESIPEFVKELIEGERKRNNIDDKPLEDSIAQGAHDNKTLMLQKLKEIGFGDKDWSQKYRNVQGYRMNQDHMIKSMNRQSIELGQQQKALVKTLKSKENLEKNLVDIIKLINKSEPTYPETKQKASDKESAIKFDGKSSSTRDFSFMTVPLEKAWKLISSSIWGHLDSRPSSSRKDELRSSRNRYGGVQTPSKTEKRTEKSVARLKKRIEKKHLAAQKLQQEINALAEKIHQSKQSIEKSKPPIPWEEYERAQIVVEEVRSEICSNFAKHIKERHNKSIEQYHTLDAKTDLTKPHEWYPYARLDRRKIIFHGGPTNSGKTYSALQRLKEAKKGLYLGPLRLLAAEVYEILTAEGFYTNLFTGQERREIAFSTHTAATIEMCNITDEYDTVVIDEIQMISDASRGASWTKALMGLRCKEIHVCGGFEAMDIVKKIANACGDDFEMNRYERFSDLKVSEVSLSRNPNKKGAYQNVQPGDCIVAFSRNDIFAIKREVESMTNYKCCVIYGKLPPKTRSDQARRFNDHDSGYDILIASDAIGMGLNLNIKRVIFNSIFKFNGEKVVRLSHSEIKQISGRAGRRNSPFPNGEVSCRDHRDLGYIRECLTTQIEPIRKAALVPTEAHIELFASAIHSYTSTNATENNVDESQSFPDLYEILRQFSAMATVKGDFFLGRQNEMTVIAKRLKTIPINLRDAYTMCLSPTTENSLKLLESFAMKVSQGEIFGLPSRPVPKKARSFDDLSNLCNIYSDVDLFMWLQYKFPPGNAVELAAALARKERTMDYINSALTITEQLKLDHCYLKTSNRHRSVWEVENGRSDNNADFVEGNKDHEDISLFLDHDDRYDSDSDENLMFEDKIPVY